MSALQAIDLSSAGTASEGRRWSRSCSGGGAGAELSLEAGRMADRRRVTVSTPRGPFEVEVSALLPQTDLSVEVAPAADSR